MGINLRFKLLQMFKKFSGFNDEKPCERELFRSKVMKIMKKEKDFSSLYDYQKILSLDENGQHKYLAEVTKRYIEERQNLINENIFNVEH